MTHGYKYNKSLLKIFILGILLLSGLTKGFAQTTLLSENFEAASGSQLITTSPGFHNWTLYINTSGQSYWYITSTAYAACVITGSYSMLVTSDDWYCNYGLSGGYAYAANKIAYRSFSATGYSSLTLSFKYKAGGESGYDYGKVCYSTNGTTWTDLSATYQGKTTAQTVTNLALPSSLDNASTVYIGFRWRNDNSYVDPNTMGFVIDDIVVQGSTACTGTPSAPVATAATNVGVNSFTANWNASASANAYYLDVSTVSNFASFVSGYNNRSVGNVTTFSVTGLTANTNYYYRVRAACTGTSSSSNTISTATALNYCSSSALSSTLYGITNVTFNTINNTTSITGGYIDYTSLSTSVSPGASYNLSVRATTGGAFTFYQKVWIDWNQDGTFSTSSNEEYALGTTTNSTGGLSSLCPLSVTVPAGAVMGTTRMRVTTRYNSYATPCIVATYNGEVEDYTIVVSNPPGKSYGIYAPGAVSGITDCEIYAQGGAGTAGCLVCSPTDAGYSSVNISDYPIITATNISCTGTNITLATSATSPDWTGSSSPLTSTGASKTFTYSSTGRKNITLAAAGSCPALSATTASPGTAIPDGGCSSGLSASSTITIPDYGSCKINTANMTVKVNITHANDADLLIYLKAPNNKLLCVSTGNGSTGDNYTNTIFSDGGATNIQSGSAPFTGTYRPEGSTGASGCGAPTSGVTTFATLGGSSYNPSGTWTLYVFDESSGTSGTFVDWTLTLPAATGGGTTTSTYTGFTNMMMAAPAAGSVRGTPTGCPGAYAYSSSSAGTPGFTYSWSVSPSTGTSIASPTSSSTNITFPSTSTTYTVTCSQTSECCGPLTAITYTTAISAPPAAATASAASATPCVGSATALTATAPANVSFAWYDAATGGNLLATGSSYTTPSVIAGANTYYVEAINTTGCSSTTRTAVVVTGTATTAPAASGVTRCGSGSATIDITSPVSGYTYNWYSGSCGGSLLQSNTGISYTGTVSSTTTFYVSATAPGCAASSCTAVTVTVNALGGSLTWVGSVSGANNWFNPTNWGGCIPTCASDVSIPSAISYTYPPDIGYNAAGGAACKSITIAATGTLSFSDAKAELSICGNLTHNGILTTNSKGIVIFSGTTAQQYTKGTLGSGDFNDIILNNTGATPTLTLNNDLTLASGGNFTFQSGKIITGTNNFIVKNTESSSMSGHNSSRYIEGNLRRYINTGVATAYDFPVGHTTKGYQLAKVNFTTVPSTISYLTASFSTYSSLPGALNLTECSATYNQNALNNGYWDIAANNSQNNVGSYTMILYPTNYSNAFSGFTIMSQHNGSSTWALVNGDGSAGTCISGGVSAVERRSMKGFSKFGIAQSLTILPVELLSFDAVYNGKSTDVNWATASETNNDYFIIERSNNAQDFYVIGKVPSKAKGGNSTSKLLYELNDPNVEKGVYYYRLKQVDFDGKTSSSSVAMVIIDDDQMLTVIPNPTDNLAEINYESYSLGIALLKVYDTRGRLVLAKELVCTKGHNNYSLDLHNEMNGMFYIVLSVGDKVYNTKLLKQ